MKQLDKTIINKIITSFLIILLIVTGIFYWFNLIAMHYIIGVCSLIILLIAVFIASSKIIDFPKKQFICLIISLVTVLIVVISHFNVINHPFIYHYKDIENGVLITGYKKTFLNNYGDFYVEIPDYIDNKKVVKIADNSFENSNDCFKLTLPGTILEIGERAFAGSNLREIYLPNSLKKIGDDAFYEANIDDIFIPSSVEYIGNNALASIDNIALEASEVPSSYDSLWNDKKANIYFNSVGIEEDNDITYVLHDDLTATVINMPKFSHSKITILNKISFNNQEYVVNTIGSNSGFNTTFTEIIIPETIIRICSNAIANKNLGSIFIPKSVLYIEENAFLGCDNLLIKVEHFEKLKTWDENWNSQNLKVEWNSQE